MIVYEGYEATDYDTVADALKKIREQYLAGGGLTWTGPDSLHFSISTGSSGPSWHFSPEGLEYHEERGRDFWDVYSMVAFQMGFHNGVVREGAKLEERHRMDERYRELQELGRGK